MLFISSSWNFRADQCLQLDHLAFVVLVLLSFLQGCLLWQVAFLGETEIADEFRVHLKELFVIKNKKFVQSVAELTPICDS